MERIKRLAEIAIEGLGFLAMILVLLVALAVDTFAQSSGPPGGGGSFFDFLPGDPRIWLVVGLFYVINEVVQAWRRDAENSITLRTIVAFWDGVKKFLSIIPGINLDRDVGPRIENPYSKKNGAGGGSTLKIILILAAVGVTSCANPVATAKQSYALTAKGIRTTQDVAGDLCIRDVLDQTTCEKIAELSGEAYAIDQAIRDLFKAIDVTKDAIEREAILQEAEALITAHFELAGSLRALYLRHKEWKEIQ